VLTDEIRRRQRAIEGVARRSEDCHRPARLDGLHTKRLQPRWTARGDSPLANIQSAEAIDRRLARSIRAAWPHGGSGMNTRSSTANCPQCST